MTPEDRKTMFREWALRQQKLKGAESYTKNTIDDYCHFLSNMGNKIPEQIQASGLDDDLFSCDDTSKITSLSNALAQLKIDSDIQSSINLYLHFLEKSPIDELIEEYNKRFKTFRQDEIYKWEAVKHFKENFIFDADDFHKMLKEALSASDNLLTGAMYFPKGMLLEFAATSPEDTRAALINLFDNNQDLLKRMEGFSGAADKLLAKLNETKELNGQPAAKQSYQDPRAMSIYLTFMHPDKYYFYKSSIYSTLTKRLGINAKSNKYSKVSHYNELCFEIEDRLKRKYPDLILESDKQIPTELLGYDPEHHLLVQDIAYHVGVKADVESVANNNDNIEANPAIDPILSDKNVPERRYWIYSPGADAYLWDELQKREEISIGWKEVGDIRQYSSKDDIRHKLQETRGKNRSFKHSALALWQFLHDLKPGDVVFAKKGVHKIIGRGVVTGDYKFDETRVDDLSHFRNIEWTDKGTWDHPKGQAVSKTLTDITPYTEYVESLNALFDEDPPHPPIDYPDYSKEDFLADVFLSPDELETLSNLIHRKKNVILQGAPGVGKTYCAKRLAYALMGKKDKSRIKMIQFHQSYSYEDFIEGYRPTTQGFEIKKGPFYKFCKTAADDTSRDYYFIIDEINRGNLSKIFGELFMLIEPDKRGVSLPLLYSDEEFKVPDNVYIIGMMNTADRSLAIMDYALRRRFAFFTMQPAFNSEGFTTYANELDSEKFNKFINTLKTLNKEISEDETLGEGFQIGHSYICNLKSASMIGDTLDNIAKYEIAPLLEEYWYDEPMRVKEWVGKFKGALQ